MKLIERRQYLDKLINVLGTPDIKVITGVRRSGKSKLLEAFRAYIESENADCNIIQINFNLPDYDDLLTYRALYDYVNAHYVAGKENFVFIDEVQMCEDFEKAVNGLHASEKYDIYITGSNAFLLSSDLATLFTGRTFEIKVYPFSFREYMEYFGLKDRYDALDKYVLEGGMSGSYLYKDQEAKYDYIADVFDTLIVRDIRKKYKIRNTQLMDRIVDFLMIMCRIFLQRATLRILLEACMRRYTIRQLVIICNICAMHSHSIRLGDMILRGRSIYRATTNTI